jgi:hypothetical protein
MGSSSALSTATTGATAETLAHRRQRGVGGEPVGVSSSTKPRHAAAMMKLKLL